MIKVTFKNITRRTVLGGICDMKFYITFDTPKPVILFGEQYLSVDKFDFPFSNIQSIEHVKPTDL